MTANDDKNYRWRVLALMTTAQSGASIVQQALGALSPILVATFALSKAQLGIVFSAISVGATCFTAISGALTDRWGERKMLFVAVSIMTFALLAATLFSDYPWLVATMTIYGAGFASSTPAGGRAILTWFGRDRGFAMGIRQTGNSIGGLIGALALPLVASLGGYRAAFGFAAALAALPGLAACVFYRESRDDAAGRATLASVVGGMTALMRDPRMIAVTLTSMLLSACQFVVNGFLTITAVNVVRTSVHVAGLALAVAFATAIGGRLGWGLVSDRWFGGGRLVPLAVIAVLAGIGASMLVCLHHGAVGLLFAASALLGLSASGWNGLMAAAFSEVGGTERAASALGLGLTGIFAASAVAPWLFGFAADRSSLSWAWAATALLSFIAAVPVLWLRARLAATAREGAKSPRPNTNASKV